MPAMLLERAKSPLKPATIATPEPKANQVLIKVLACGVCRTDLHIFDGELDKPKLPLVLGHEIVGRIEALAPGAEGFAVGDRVGVPWLGFTDGTCAYCRAGEENLCDDPRFTGYQIDGGYAAYTVADARYVFKLPEGYSDAEAAPLLCAGLIGYRSLKLAREPLKGDLSRLGIYGFGAAAHIVAQVARAQGAEVYAFTRPGDAKAQDFARDLGAVWAGGSDQAPPSARSHGGQGRAQRRRRRVRRHPHERHSKLPLCDLVGRARATLGGQSHPRRCPRISGARPHCAREDVGRANAARQSQRGP